MRNVAPEARPATIASSLAMGLCVAALAGCNGGGSPGGGGSAIQADDGGTFVSCAGETRATPYTAGMQVAAVDGAVTLKLLSSQPGPPIKGTDSWTVQFLDGTGAPSAGQILSVVPYMPDHRHGTSITPVITPQNDPATLDTFVIDPLYLFMAGYWEITFNVTTGGGAADSVMFPICIPD
jgi:hypothetical protein